MSLRSLLTGFSTKLKDKVDKPIANIKYSVGTGKVMQNLAKYQGSKIGQAHARAGQDVSNILFKAPVQFGQQMARDIGDLGNIAKLSLQTKTLPSIGIQKDRLGNLKQQTGRVLKTGSFIAGAGNPLATAGYTALTGGINYAANRISGADSKTALENTVASTLESVPKSFQMAGISKFTNPVIDKAGLLGKSFVGRNLIKSPLNVVEGRIMDKATGYETTLESQAIDAFFPIAGELASKVFKSAGEAMRAVNVKLGGDIRTKKGSFTTKDKYIKGTRAYFKNNNSAYGALAGVEPYQDEQGNWKVRFNKEKAGFGILVMAGLSNRADIQKNFIDALKKGSDEPVKFGKLSDTKFNEINSRLAEMGQPTLESKELLIHPNVIKKLIEKRIRMDKMSPDQLADVAYSAIHNTKSRVSDTAHPQIKALIKPINRDLSNAAYVGKHGETGTASIKSIYLKKNTNVNKDALEGRRNLPSSRPGFDTQLRSSPRISDFQDNLNIQKIDQNVKPSGVSEQRKVINLKATRETKKPVLEPISLGGLKQTKQNASSKSVQNPLSNQPSLEKEVYQAYANKNPAVQTPRGSVQAPPQAKDLINKPRLQEAQNKTPQMSTNLVSSQEIVPQTDPVKKIILALKEAKPLRGNQEALYNKARSQKFARLMSTRGKTGGEAGYFKELGTLKGELPKVKYESIRNQLNQTDVDTLFNRVNEANIGEWEKLTAKSGLAKLLGQEGTAVPTQGELTKLNDVFGSEFTKTLLDKRSFLEKAMSVASDVINIPRSLMASFDLSAPFRQGIFMIGRPKQWTRAFGSMLDSFRSDKAYKAVFENISQRPTYKIMREHRLAITDPQSILGNREEQFMSNLVEKVPGLNIPVKASNRAYSAFLNKLRADVFDDLLTKGKDLGLEKDADFLNSLASFVNNATGRGELPGGIQGAAKVLNGAFFSPRLMFSRLNLLNPAYYAKLQPNVRKEALKSLLTFAGAGLTITSLASLAGADVGTDPRSSDFGKIKIGNTRYDVWGGFQQYIKLAGQLISGKLISTTTGKEYTLGEGYKPITRLGITGKFLQSKESPVMGFALGLLEGQNGLGEKFDAGKELVDRFIPMVLSDMYDLQKEWGPKGVLMGIPGLFGVGSQTYGRQFPVQETTATGKPTIKMRGETGLAEDIVNAVRGTPKTTIPQNQWNTIQKKKQSETNLNIARDKVKKSQQIEQTEDYIVYFDKESGETKSIKKTPNLSAPKLTGQRELDKELLSDYKSSISKRINDVVKLYELGQMTEEQAQQEITKLNALKSRVSSVTKKAKQVNLASISQKILKPVSVQPTKVKFDTFSILDEFRKVKAPNLTPPKIERPKFKKG